MPLLPIVRSVLRLGGVAAVAAAAVLAPATAHAATTLIIAPGQSWSSVLDHAHRGDTIVVAQGVHPAQRLIGGDYTGVTLRGASRTATVVRGLYLKDVTGLTVQNLSSVPTGSYRDGAAVKVSYACTGITLDGISAVPRTSNSVAGFDISRGGTSAPSHITITNSFYDGSAVHGTSGRGLRVWAGNVPAAQWPSDITLTGSKLVNASADLVQIGGGKDVTIRANTLRSPQANADHNDGVQSYGSTRLVVKDNTISAPGRYEGPDQGIILGHSSPANNYLRVTDSVVEGNDVTEWRGQGITIAGTDDTTITGNTVTKLNPMGSSMVLGPGQWGYSNVAADIHDNAFGKVTQVGS